MSEGREIIEEKINIGSSSLIDYLIYNRSTKLLRVGYKRGRYKHQERAYKDVSIDEYNSVMQSNTKGRTLIKILKKKKEENRWYNKLLRFIRLKHN